MMIKIFVVCYMPLFYNKIYVKSNNTTINIPLNLLMFNNKNKKIL